MSWDGRSAVGTGGPVRVAEPVGRPTGIATQAGRGRVGISVAAGALAAAVVLYATRDGPNLSPDSLTYLSAGEALRGLDGYVDFTGEPLAHFPPLYPTVLALGGTSVQWASLVGAAAAAATVALLVGLLARRARPAVALAAGVALALAQGAVWVWSTVWSEAPYITLSVATIAVLAGAPLDVRRSRWGGVLAALGFLTRYAGVGLVVTGLVMVIAGTRPGNDRRRFVVAYLSVPVAAAASWTVRNLMRSGEPFGPHFEGGAGESIGTLADRLARSVGRLVLDVDRHDSVAVAAGYVVLSGFLAAVAVTILRRDRDIVDIGMGTFALLSVAVPLVSRVVAATHVEARIMSPLLVAMVYFAARVVGRAGSRRLVLAGCAIVALVWSWQGIVLARDFPDRLPSSAGGEPPAGAAALYRYVGVVADGAVVLTNSPQRVWWYTGHEPTVMAFTVAEPGNSHFPLTAAETVEVACSGEAYLAWFPGLQNAAGRGPRQLRPDVAAQVALTTVASTDRGAVYRVEAADASACTP